MNEHTEPFREEAREITFRLLDRALTDAPYTPDIDVREGLYIGDVQEEARQFTQDAELLRRLDLPFPVIQAEENRNVPIALHSYDPHTGYPRRRHPDPYLADTLYNFVREWEQTPPGADGKTIVAVGEAEESVKGGMVEFLATRIASVVEFFGGHSPRPDVSSVPLTLPQRFLGRARVKTVGFTVTVSTHTPSLRIHISPVFRLNFRFFGSPTTPVVSTLTGGIYLFGVDGGPYPYGTITPDPTKFDIPYQTVLPQLLF
jgi:hypothetical protein